MTTETATYVPTTTLPVEGRIFFNMEKRIAVRLIATFAAALAESDDEFIELEATLWNAFNGACLSIGGRNAGMLASGEIVDSGLHVNDQWKK